MIQDYRELKNISEELRDIYKNWRIFNRFVWRMRFYSALMKTKHINLIVNPRECGVFKSCFSKCLTYHKHWFPYINKSSFFFVKNNIQFTFSLIKKTNLQLFKEGTQSYYISATELHTTLPIFLFLKKAWHFVLEKGKKFKFSSQQWLPHLYDLSSLKDKKKKNHYMILMFF